MTKDYEAFIQKLLAISPVPVSFEEITDGAKGYFSPSVKKIVVQKDMTNLQTIQFPLHSRLEQRKRYEGTESFHGSYPGYRRTDY